MGAPGAASGSRIETRVPPRGAESTVISPPLISASRHALGSPSPMPRPASRPLKNGSNARRRVSASIPAPSSTTLTSHRGQPPSPSNRRASSVTRPPAATASSALTTTSRRLSPTWAGSTATSTGVGGGLHSRRAPRAVASGRTASMTDVRIASTTTAVGAGFGGRANTMSPPIMSRPRNAWSMIAASRRRRSGDCSSRSSAWARVAMFARGLMISWPAP